MDCLLSVTDETLTSTRTFSGYGEMDVNAVSIAGNPKYNYTLTRDLAGRIIKKIETIGGAVNSSCKCAT